MVKKVKETQMKLFDKDLNPNLKSVKKLDKEEAGKSRREAIRIIQEAFPGTEIVPEAPF